LKELCTLHFSLCVTGNSFTFKCSTMSTLTIKLDRLLILLSSNHYLSKQQSEGLFSPGQSDKTDLSTDTSGFKPLSKQQSLKDYSLLEMLIVSGDITIVAEFKRVIIAYHRRGSRMYWSGIYTD